MPPSQVVAMAPRKGDQPASGQGSIIGPLSEVMKISVFSSCPGILQRLDQPADDVVQLDETVLVGILRR